MPENLNGYLSVCCRFRHFRKDSIISARDYYCLLGTDKYFHIFCYDTKITATNGKLIPNISFYGIYLCYSRHRISYLNALKGKGVQIVTVNDYLAKRDAEWMGQVHRFLGMTVGVVLNDMTSEQRKEAYACDITYVTNNELGFDYLRDNMSIYKEQLVLRDLDYCIIDEVDSVLIDEARTPLIISGQSGKSTKLYEVCTKALLL